jgi:glyoxylase-like metal-dependent hydrolase (beta-lactamase superfamily II)
MDMIASGGRYEIIDLCHLGRPASVAAYLLRTGSGPFLVDPGPSSTLPRLEEALARAGLSTGSLAGLLLTHIHLDHAGASGTLAGRNPNLRVYVHAKGAPHLIAPAKLLSSAQRLYGARMEELWGEIAPVPEAQVVVLEGGERLEFDGLALEVAYTPGHAIHHVCYFEPESRVAFVGDTAGIRGPRLPVVLPVTPPPDFDLQAWLASITRLLSWNPRELLLTHFGPSEDPASHLGALRDGLLAWTGYVRETLALDAPDEARIRAFVEKLRAWISDKVPADRAEQFLAGAGPEACWQGIARYERTAGEAAGRKGKP